MAGLMRLVAGERLGPYALISPIGEGGMGEVWKARDTRLDRIVALKVSKEQFSDRFMNEARAIAALNHPNICTLFDVGPNYLVMELLEGVPLTGPISVEKAVAVGGQILDALDAAHRKGFVHRDLKPANLLVTKQGIKLLDFGLAKLGPSLKGGDETLTQALTQAGEIVGTLQYMAPEQLQGRPVDARSDLFAFGCVLYELLSGKRAFPGSSTASIIAAILEREPEVLDLTPPLDRVLRTCLAKDPDARFQNALDLKRALEWAVAAPTDAGAGMAPRRTPWAWAVAGVAAVLAVLAVWAPWRGSVAGGERGMVRLDLEAGPEEVFDPAISADGKVVAYVSNRMLHVRNLDRPEARTLAGTEGAEAPFLSVDGKWVAYTANRRLFKILSEGGTPEALVDSVWSAPGVWLEDGSIVFEMPGLGETRILRRLAPGGKEPVAFSSGIVRNPTALPGGKGLLVEGNRNLIHFPAGGGEGTVVMQRAQRGRYIDGGYLVFFRNGGLYAVRFDLDRMRPEGEEVALLDGVDAQGLRGVQYDVSAKGDVVYRRGRKRSSERVISWLGPNGELAPILTKPGQYSSPRISPDGKRLALTVQQQGEKNVWVMELGGERMTRLTQGQPSRTYVVWTGDGQQLIYGRDDGKLGWVRADGGGSEGASTFEGSSPRSMAPGGRQIVYNQRGEAAQGLELAIADVGGSPFLGNARKLLEQPGLQSAGAISPDGKWIAYHSDENVQREIYVRPFPASGPIVGAKWQVSTEGGRLATWSKSTKELFWKGLDQRIWVASYSEAGGAFVAGKPRVWADTRLPDTGVEPNFDISADGKRVLAVLDAEAELKPETHLRLVLGIGGELKRRMEAAVRKQ